MLYIIVNDRKNISYSGQYNNIYKNQQKLITGYDIYNTFSHLLFGDKYELIPNKAINQDSPKSQYGISLFNEINSKDRYPSKYIKKFNKKMPLDVCV